MGRSGVAAVVFRYFYQATFQQPYQSKNYATLGPSFITPKVPAEVAGVRTRNSTATYSKDSDERDRHYQQIQQFLGVPKHRSAMASDKAEGDSENKVCSLYICTYIQAVFLTTFWVTT